MPFTKCCLFMQNVFNAFYFDTVPKWVRRFGIALFFIDISIFGSFVECEDFFHTELFTQAANIKQSIKTDWRSVYFCFVKLADMSWIYVWYFFFGLISNCYFEINKSKATGMPTAKSLLLEISKDNCEIKKCSILIVFQRVFQMLEFFFNFKQSGEENLSQRFIRKYQKNPHLKPVK